MSDDLLVSRLGTISYQRGLELQRELADARIAGRVGDVLLLLEHDPVFTKGRRTEPGELPMGEEFYRRQGIDVCDSDRGGRVTFHGPGQLVGYPIVSLRPHDGDVGAYVRRLERVMIATLASLGVGARAIEGLTGIWTNGNPPPGNPRLALAEQRAGARASEQPAGGHRSASVANARKIGSIGIHVRRSVTTHGFALNINNDLEPFEWVVPCGIDGAEMTSLSRELGHDVGMNGVIDTTISHFGELHGREALELTPEELTELTATKVGV